MSESGFDSSEDVYEVDRIIDVRLDDVSRMKQYRVRWQGCGPEDDTWEPKSNLLTCDDLLKNFEIKRDEELRLRKLERKKLKKKKKNEEQLDDVQILPVSTVTNAKNLDLQTISIKTEPMTIEEKKNDKANSNTKKMKTNLSVLHSPINDFDDTAGMTRKQRQEFNRLMEQSKNEVGSPSSSSADVSSLSNCNGIEERFKRKVVSPTESNSNTKKFKKNHQDIGTDSDQSDEVVMRKRKKKTKHFCIIDETDTEDAVSNGSCNEPKSSNTKTQKPSDIIQGIFGTGMKPGAPTQSNATAPNFKSNTPLLRKSAATSLPQEETQLQSNSNNQTVGENYVSLMAQLQNKTENTITLSDPASKVSTQNAAMKNKKSTTSTSALADRIKVNCGIKREETLLLNAIESGLPDNKSKLANTYGPQNISSKPVSLSSAQPKRNIRKNVMQGVQNIRNLIFQRSNSSDSTDNTGNEKHLLNGKQQVQSSSSIQIKKLMIDIKETKIYTEGVEPLHSTCNETASPGANDLLGNIFSEIDIALPDSDIVERVDEMINQDFAIEKPSDSIVGFAPHKLDTPSLSNTDFTAPLLANPSKIGKDDTKNSTVKLPSTSTNNELLKNGDHIKYYVAEKSSKTSPSNVKTVGSIISTTKQVTDKTSNKNVANKTNLLKEPKIKATLSFKDTEEPAKLPLRKTVSSPAMSSTVHKNKNTKVVVENVSTDGNKKNKKSISVKDYMNKTKKRTTSVEDTGIFLGFTPLPRKGSVDKNIKVKNSSDKTKIIAPKVPTLTKQLSLSKPVEKELKKSEVANEPDILSGILESISVSADTNEQTNEFSNQVQETDKQLQVECLEEDEDIILELSDIETDLEEYSGDEDGMLMFLPQHHNKQSHLTEPGANTKLLSNVNVYQAILQGDIQTVVECKISEDIDEYVQNGETLLMKAVMECAPDMVQILLEKNADPNKVGENGKTSLMVATELKQKRLVSLLIRNGAFLNIQTGSGETALIMACKLGHVEIVHVLINSGADVHPALTYLERMSSSVPVHLQYILKSTLQDQHDKLKEMLETVLIGIFDSASIVLGKSLMGCRCFSPNEIDEHDFFLPCDVDVTQISVNVILLALPVSFQKSGSIDIDFTEACQPVDEVLLNGVPMICALPDNQYFYYLFPKVGEVNIVKIKSSCPTKILFSVYPITHIRTMQENQQKVMNHSQQSTQRNYSGNQQVTVR